MTGEFSISQIEPGPSVIGLDEALVPSMRMTIGQSTSLFEMHTKFAANQTDFFILIKNFAIPDRWSGGVEREFGRRKFSIDEARLIRERIVSYFMGPEEKRFLPFTFVELKGSRCLGVEFSEKWILIDPAKTPSGGSHGVS